MIGAYRGCGHKDKDCVLLEVQTAHYDLEDASDMPLAQQFNDRYYILRSEFIQAEHFKEFFTMPATREAGYDDHEDDDIY